MKPNDYPVRRILLAAAVTAGALVLETGCDNSSDKETRETTTQHSVGSVPEMLKELAFQKAVEGVENDADKVAHGILRSLAGAPAPKIKKGSIFIADGPESGGINPPTPWGPGLNDLPPHNYVLYDARNHYLVMGLDYGWRAQRSDVDIRIADLSELVDEESSRVKRLTVVNSKERGSQELSIDSKIEDLTPENVGYDSGGPEEDILLDPYELGATRRDVKSIDYSLHVAQHTLFSMLNLPDAL
jgi:hypothetical protein